VAAALLLTAVTAGAQAEDQAAARVLFAEGRRLMKEGRYEQACPKLQAASKLYQGSGVRLNLADCFAHTGRFASAWSEFAEAAAVATETGRADDVLEAKKRQAELEPRLSRLTIRVAKDVPGLVVKRDGTVIDRGAWGTPLPVDPGTIALGAEAPGYSPWTKSIRIAEPGATAVDVPELTLAEGGATPTSRDASEHHGTGESHSYWTGRRILGASIAGAGVVGVGVGGVLGLLAKSQYDTATNESGAARHNDSVSAVSAGNVATVVLAVGAGVAAAGAVLWLTAPSTGAAVGTSGTAIFLRGTF